MLDSRLKRDSQTVGAAIRAPIFGRSRSFPMPIAAFIPPYAPDAIELLLVMVTVLLSLGIMVAFGAWWSR